jgi:hypothetical protein
MYPSAHLIEILLRLPRGLFISHRLPKLTEDFCCEGFLFRDKCWTAAMKYRTMSIVLLTNRKDYESFYTVGSEIWS